MPITGFTSTIRPNAASLNAAYRPIIFQPAFSTIVAPFPPVVYCDVYFNSTYYKTLTSTSYQQTSAFSAPYWIFDIQTVAQEYLKSNFPPLTSIGLTTTLPDLLGVNGSCVSCYCKFRVSTIDVNGFIVPEGSNGSGGFISPTFYILNSTLQHEDSQDLKTHLLSYKMPAAAGIGNYEIIPLTHRLPGDIVSKYDYDHFPFFPISLNNGNFSYALGINFKIDGDVTFQTAYTGYNYGMLAGVPMFMPSGIIQLRQLAWNSSLYPVPVPVVVPFDDIVEYSVFIHFNRSVFAPTPATASFNTPLFKTTGCNCSKSHMRLRFQNYVGFYDCVNFSEIDGSFITTSDQWQKVLKYPLNKSDGGMKRLNVRSNEQFTISTCEYGEDKQEWLKELFDSPDVYIEWPGIQGQAPANIPIIIKDGEFITRKSRDRYEYVTQLVFTMANETIRQRN